MLQPKVVAQYVEKIDEVTREFIEIVKQTRDDNGETPAKFADLINRWALESIGVIALNSRLDVLRQKPGNEGDRLGKLVAEMLELSFQLDVMPSLWRYIPTRKSKRFIKVSDEITE